MFVELLFKPEWYDSSMSLIPGKDVIEVVSTQRCLIYSVDLGRLLRVPRTLRHYQARIFVTNSIDEVCELIKKSEQQYINEI